MTHVIKHAITPARRRNLTALADYLEALPEGYAHFDMETYIGHEGGCDLAEGFSDVRKEVLEEFGNYDSAECTAFVDSVEDFLNNCGTVACALGHGPAAGVPLAKTHIRTKKLKGATIVTAIDFDSYAKKFVDGTMYSAWDFLFSGDWKGIDDHHWGAAARIRFYLDKRGIPADPQYPDYTLDFDEAVEVYKPYRVDKRLAAAAS